MHDTVALAFTVDVFSCSSRPASQPFGVEPRGESDASFNNWSHTHHIKGGEAEAYGWMYEHGSSNSGNPHVCIYVCQYSSQPNPTNQSITAGGASAPGRAAPFGKRHARSSSYDTVPICLCGKATSARPTVRLSAYRDCNSHARVESMPRGNEVPRIASSHFTNKYPIGGSVAFLPSFHFLSNRGAA